MAVKLKAGRDFRVLVVEDDPANRMILTKVLGGEGYDVRAVTNSREALSEVDRWHPSVILLDVGLEGVDGYEVCRRIRATGNKTPIIFVTGRVEETETLKGFEAGGDDYIVKPYSFDELKARVRAQLRKVVPPHSLPVGDLRRFLALRLWPATLAIVFLCLALVSNAYPGLPNAQAYTTVMSWGAFVSTAAVAIAHLRMIRYMHVFFGFSTCLTRSLFGLIGWTNEPNATSQLLGASVWGAAALGILTIYLLTLPFVVDEQIEKALAV